MKKNNILFSISGSIACYKSAETISKLVQQGHSLQVVVTGSALNFIGAATLEGLSGRSVMSDTFEHGNMMSHINLVKWADIMILAPATASTINSMSHGLGKNLVSTLFLAHDWEKPYFIAPAMNTKMWSHPATIKSVNQLKKWGVKILDPDSGALACGDYGPGRMVEPDKIVKSINYFLENKKNFSMLITAGGTKEPIDGARYISNISTGRTASTLADVFIKSNWDVTYLSSEDAKIPSGDFKHITFSTTIDLEQKLNELIHENKFDALLHNAAVSDYVPVNTDQNKKIDSGNKKLTLELKRSPKLVDSLIKKSKNKNMRLIAFKLTVNLNEIDQKIKVDKLIKDSNADFIVQNDTSDRKNHIQTQFSLYNQGGKISNFPNAIDLGDALQNIIGKILL